MPALELLKGMFHFDSNRIQWKPCIYDFDDPLECHATCYYQTNANTIYCFITNTTSIYCFVHFGVYNCLLRSGNIKRFIDFIVNDYF